MTEPEKKLLRDQCHALRLANEQLYASWDWLQRIQRQLKKLLAASETEDGMKPTVVCQWVKCPSCNCAFEIGDDGKAKCTCREKPAASSVPVEPFLPGEYLKDEIEARGWTLVDAASKSHWLTVQDLREVIVGSWRVTLVVAHLIADMFGQDDASDHNATVWLNLQESYDRACAERNRKEPSEMEMETADQHTCRGRQGHCEAVVEHGALCSACEAEASAT